MFASVSNTALSRFSFEPCRPHRGCGGPHLLPQESAKYPVACIPARQNNRRAARSSDRARLRFLEFFASNIRNRHTRRAYIRAVTEFLDWCAVCGWRLVGCRCGAAACRRMDRRQNSPAVGAERQTASGGYPSYVRLAGDWANRGGQSRLIGAWPVACRENRQNADPGCRGSASFAG